MRSGRSAARRVLSTVRRLATVLGLARCGIYIPYREAAALEPCDYPAIAELFAAREGEFRRWLEAVDRYRVPLSRVGGPPPAPRFDQDWFPRLDAALAYAVIRELAPARIIEIGCGHSTRFLARAVSDGHLATRHICIDPAPRAGLEALAVEHHALPLERVAESLFQELAAGDVLFVDSSHVAVPGSDVDRILHRVLPRLPRGVVLHFHDIFLPDPYPAAWAHRAYNEQLPLASWLLAGGLEPMIASHWVTTRRPHWIEACWIGRIPLAPGVWESSLWAVRR